MHSEPSNPASNRPMAKSSLAHWPQREPAGMTAGIAAAVLAAESMSRQVWNEGSTFDQGPAAA